MFLRYLKDFFIPHSENNYAPHSLQKFAVGGMLAMILISFTLTNVQSIIWITSDWMVSTILPAVIFDKTNKERESEALGTLVRSSVLDEAAQMKAEHMAKNEYFAHYSPEGISPWYWFSQVGYNYVHAGENLAINFTDSDEVVKAWMNSPTHRANIMNGNYIEIGIGTAKGEYQGFPTVYVVQLFGTPAKAAQPIVAGATTPGPKPVVATTITPKATTSPVKESTSSQTVLARNITITETIENVPAKPVPVVVATPVTATTGSSSVVADIDVSDAGVVLYSDFMATTTAGIPASLADISPGGVDRVPAPYKVLTEPRLILQIIYSIIGFFVLGSLILSVFIELRQQQPLQIAYSCILLMLMGGLMYVHLILTAGAAVV